MIDLTPLLTIIITLVLCFSISFGITALIFKGICWAFSLTFSWKVAFGIWLIMILVGSIFSGTKHVKKVN